MKARSFTYGLFLFIIKENPDNTKYIERCVRQVYTYLVYTINIGENMPKGRPKQVTENKEQSDKAEVKEVKEKTKTIKKTVSAAPEIDKTKSMVDSIYGDLLDMTEREDSFFPSGSMVIDSVLSNGLGIPMGKFISLTAAEGVGKSSMCLHIARNCCAKGYHCLYIDTECGLNRSQLDSFSMLPFVENQTFFPKYIRTYGELDTLLTNALEKDKNLKFIFLDSLTDLVTDQVLQNNIAEINQPGLDARAQSLLFRKFKFPLADAGITTFFILQQRTKIGMAYGERSMDQGAGGHAVKHGMDISLELSKKEFLTKTIKGHDKPIPYGAECYLTSKKNRYAPPMIPMQIQIIFGKGVSNSGAISNALVLNGYAKTPTKTKYVIDYKGEEVTCTSKAKFDAFIKDHLDYYKNIVESFGGIKLIPDSEVIQPVIEAQESNDDVIEELCVEDSAYEESTDDDGIINLD